MDRREQNIAAEIDAIDVAHLRPQEALVNFAHDARNVYVHAAQRQLEGTMPPILQDKPITMLGFTAFRLNSDSSEERLGVSTLTTSHEQVWQRSPSGEQELQYKGVLALRLAGVLLDNGTVFDEVVPADASGIHAQYYYYPAKKPSVEVLSSFLDPEASDAAVAEDTPTELMERAEDFMYDVLEYVHESEFDTSLRVGHPLQVPHIYGKVVHSFELEISPLLPLSGKEDQDFLRMYHRQMLDRFNKAHDLLAQIEETGITSGKLHEDFVGRVAAYRKAAERASRFLG